MLKRSGYALVLGVLAAGIVLAMGREAPENGAAALFDQSYDPSREVTFEGRVLKVDPAPCASLPISNLHLHMLLPEGPAEINLGPCWYVQGQPLQFKKGDLVSGIGSDMETKAQVARVIVARKIRRGKEILRLRDSTGKPLWRQKPH
jgi:hypothetical protein